MYHLHVEACNLILSPPHKLIGFLKESRDQLQPASFPQRRDTLIYYIQVSDFIYYCFLFVKSVPRDSEGI